MQDLTLSLGPTSRMNDSSVGIGKPRVLLTARMTST
jgi:hypothetical protein